MEIKKTAKFPLGIHTPSNWATEAIRDMASLFNDHAYLERKAASNALDLLNRWPEPQRPHLWETILAGIARDESLHLHQVLEKMRKKNIRLRRQHKSQYAADLRKYVRQGEGPNEIMDRLLISALIEARSCERFVLLAESSKDKDLARFYKGLAGSEAGHYKIFLDLAMHIESPTKANLRWHEFIKIEDRVIQQQPCDGGLHSWVSPTLVPASL